MEIEKHSTIRGSLDLEEIKEAITEYMNRKGIPGKVVSVDPSYKKEWSGQAWDDGDDVFDGVKITVEDPIQQVEPPDLPQPPEWPKSPTIKEGDDRPLDK